MSQSFQRVVLNFHKRFDYEEISGVRDSVKSRAASQKILIAKEMTSLSLDSFECEHDLEGYKSHLEANAEFLGEMVVLADELCILALHKKLEITLRKLLQKFYPNLNVKNLHKIDYLKKNLDFDITKLHGYASADELRSINNAIKHQGEVSKPLTQYPNWIEGTPLTGLHEAFIRLSPGVEAYVASFCDAVRDDLRL